MEEQPKEDEEQEIALNWTSETSTKQKPEKIKQEDEELEIEDIIEETSFQQPQPIPQTFEEEPEPIQDLPIQNLETDLQNTPSEPTQEQAMSYDSNAGAYDRAPSLISAPTFEKRVQGIQQQTRFETPSSWEHTKTQNTAWQQANINETAHVSQTIDEKKYDFSEDFAKRRRG